MKSLLNISCLRISLCLLFCLAGTSFIYTLYAQIPDRVFKTDFQIDPEKKGELSVEFDNLSFFKDDEYTGSFMKGYTLPGLWLQAKAVYCRLYRTAIGCLLSVGNAETRSRCSFATFLGGESLSEYGLSGYCALER